VDFLARIIVVDVLALAVDRTLDLVGTVLHTPEPCMVSVNCFSIGIKSCLHVVLVKTHPNFVTLSVASIITARDIIISTAGDRLRSKTLMMARPVFGSAVAVSRLALDPWETTSRFGA
jgi:hypothetical protein